jgi:peptidoglycan hydrolase-like protein with peptidoglycan-binding domain
VTDRTTTREVQRLLNARGYDAGPEDGVLGPKSHDAIRTFQADAGLPLTGEISATLIDRLQAGTTAAAPATPPAAGRDAAEGLVGAIKAELHRLGYDTGPASGFMTMATRYAIVGYQQDAGFAVTGRPSPALLQSLRADESQPGSALSKQYRKVEALLDGKNYAVGPVDGVIDDRTRQAIREFEEEAGMPVTGRPSAALLDRLKS